MRPGVTNIRVGLVICALGIFITAVTYGAAQGGGVYFVAWGAILAGAIQFLAGLIQYSQYARGPTEDERSKFVLKTMVHCMVYVASPDRALHGPEVATIKGILHSLSNLEIGDDAIEKIANQEDPFIESPHVAERSSWLKTDEKEMIIRACLLVAQADGGISDMESWRIGRVVDRIAAGAGTLASIAKTLSIELPKSEEATAYY